MLKYPSQAGGLNSDFVTFQPMPYRANARGGPGGGAGGPASTGAQSVILYMPESTPQVMNGQDWNSSGNQFMGPLGAAKRDFGMLVTGAVMDAGTGGNSDLIDRMKKQFDGFMKDQAGGAARQAGLNMAQGVLGGTPNQLLAISRGQVYNPNVELLYSAPKMRSFSFTFRFVPKNSGESQAMNQIIRNFKIWSAPKENGGMFEIPHVWQVSYKGPGANFMNKFKKAALTNIAVQANPDTDMHVGHIDGAPISTTMNLTFQEVDIITRDDQQNSGGQGF